MADNDVGNPIGGKKMMLKRLLEMVEEEGIEGRDSRTSGESVVMTGKDHRRNKGISEIEGKLLRYTSSTRRRGLKAKMSGLIAFNADYHVPKPHPPKNN